MQKISFDVNANFKKVVSFLVKISFLITLKVTEINTKND